VLSYCARARVPRAEVVTTPGAPPCFDPSLPKLTLAGLEALLLGDHAIVVD